MREQSELLADISKRLTGVLKAGSRDMTTHEHGQPNRAKTSQRSVLQGGQPWSGGQGARWTEDEPWSTRGEVYPAERVRGSRHVHTQPKRHPEGVVWSTSSPPSLSEHTTILSGYCMRRPECAGMVASGDLSSDSADIELR